jgi:hypothetical protein
MMLLFNASGEDTEFKLPLGKWHLLLDSHVDAARPEASKPLSGLLALPARSVLVLGILSD